MVLVPWWQASAEYRTINEILAEARRVAETLGDEWTLQLISTYEATTRIWQGMLRQGLAQTRATYEASGLPLEASLGDLPPMQSVQLLALAAPRIAAALACWLCGRTAQAWRIAEDVLGCTSERRVPQAQAVAAVTSAIMAQLDGEREVVIKLAGEALHLADEMSTRQWRQWARSLLWWAGEGMEEPEVPGPLLRPYFLVLKADDPRTDTERALALLTEALETSRATGERFCETEILRVRAGRLSLAGRLEAAADDYEAAVGLAQEQGAKMLELRALTDWAQLPGVPDRVRSALQACATEVAAGGPSQSLDLARKVLGSS
jgi:hypothetical protein